jgi:hypothetical protein
MFENDTIFPLLIGNAANYLFSSWSSSLLEIFYS